jgi:hypothetical protein
MKCFSPEEDTKLETELISFKLENLVELMHIINRLKGIDLTIKVLYKQK